MTSSPVPDSPDEESAEIAALVRSAAAGDAAASEALFSRYRERLKRMVHLRLNRQLQGRVDDSDVVQEASLDAARRLSEYAQDPQLPFFLWLRHLTGAKLLEVHRRHLGAQMRDASQEISLYHGALPEANSVSLAAQLLGTMTSPSQQAIRAETRIYVQEALNAMDPLDREILALKHFEQLSLSEIGQVVGLSKGAAGSRYLRAIKRLKNTLSQIPGFQGM